ncbi:MAG TPA: imidazolonepropionase [Thermoplasmata archaeon]|nr:imidazolonepropionase [Thermoplasmata archaeon]
MMPRAHKIRATRGEVPEAARAPRSLLLVHAAELLTLRGPPGPRIHEAAGELSLIEDGAVYAEGDRIVDVGTTSDVLSGHPRADVRIDATSKVVLPGFVDPHTHPVFAGSRAHEVEWKAQGLSYAEIAARGGGILHTVRETREASEESLAREAAARLRSMRASGTTTAEAKSGYGLRTPDELKLLRAIDRAGRLADVDVVPTFLGAHAIPPEFAGRPDAYVDLVAGEMLEAVVAGRLASGCDVFVDRGYFSADQARRILRKAAASDLRLKVHADELEETGGAALAAEVRASSADHLNRTSSAGVEALAGSGVVAVLLPATCLSSHLPFADGRRFVAAGVPVALGTDFSPNNWCDSMPFAIALACHHNGLTPAEAIVGATINAAHAIDRAGEVGALEPGKRADILVLELPSWRHLGYRLSGNPVEAVIRGGRVLEARRPRA